MSQNPPNNHRKDICILISSFGSGGVERMLVNLARGFAERGADVDFVVSHEKVPYVSQLPEKVRMITIGEGGADNKATRLTGYLRTWNPRILLSAKSSDDHLALAARQASGCGSRVFLRVGTTLSGRSDFRNVLKRFSALRHLRRQISEADGIIAVCEGVADDLCRLTGYSREKIDVVYNPVIDEALFQNSSLPVEHPWFDNASGSIPVILSVGRLAKVKGYDVLLKAFARLREDIQVRLVILGEGGQREKLTRLARRLSITDSLWMPGFVENPYPYIARSHLFVLSSFREGSPNALTEALALGVPCVATDCPSGPREILQNGDYGQLITVGHEDELLSAMNKALSSERNVIDTCAAVKPFCLNVSVDNYLRVFGLDEIIGKPVLEK